MIHVQDKSFLTKLVDKRKSTERLTITDRSNKFEWGLHFEEIFKDINPSILIEPVGDDVYVKADKKSIPQHTNLVNNVYSFHNYILDVEVRVLQRIALLRQLENERYIIWINNGHRTTNITLKDKIFFLANQEDIDYIKRRYNYMVIATNELIDYVDNKFLDKDERRFRCSQRTSRIAIAVSIFIGILSLLCQSATKGI